MIEMEDHTSDLSEARIPFLDYKTYTDRNFFLPSKDGANDAMITRKLEIPEARRAIVAQALNQFSNLLNSKTFLINVSLRLFVDPSVSQGSSASVFHLYFPLCICRVFQFLRPHQQYIPLFSFTPVTTSIYVQKREDIKCIVLYHFLLTVCQKGYYSLFLFMCHLFLKSGL